MGCYGGAGYGYGGGYGGGYVTPGYSGTVVPGGMYGPTGTGTPTGEGLGEPSTDKKDKKDKKGTNGTMLNNKAKLVVELPTDAKLFIDDLPMKTTSNVRAFNTPELERGQAYYYMVRVETVRDGKPVSETRRVIVRAGQTARADFTDMDTEAVRTARVRTRNSPHAKAQRAQRKTRKNSFFCFSLRSLRHCVRLFFILQTGSERRWGRRGRTGRSLCNRLAALKTAPRRADSDNWWGRRQRNRCSECSASLPARAIPSGLASRRLIGPHQTCHHLAQPFACMRRRHDPARAQIPGQSAQSSLLTVGDQDHGHIGMKPGQALQVIQLALQIPAKSQDQHAGAAALE
jgi:uncharacterized protein (TIGR03000 family)